MWFNVVKTHYIILVYSIVIFTTTLLHVPMLEEGMITTVTEKCRPENLPFRGLFRVLNNRDFSLLLSPYIPEEWFLERGARSDERI